MAQKLQKSSAPDKQFTKEEIEKHNKEDDCWLVIDNTVYDVTSVLKWHPGGVHPIMGHAGANLHRYKWKNSENFLRSFQERCILKRLRSTLAFTTLTPMPN